MNTITLIILIFGGVLLGGALGYYIRILITLSRRGSMELELKKMTIQAKEDAQKIIDGAKLRAEEHTRSLEESKRTQEIDFKKTEDRLIKKEEFLDIRQAELDKQSELLKSQQEDIVEKRNSLEKLEEAKRTALQEIAKLDESEAKERLMKSVEEKYEQDILVRMQKMEQTAEEKLNMRAKDILATAIQRYAGSTASEFMTTNVAIPSDDVKGKIIGKEGRNIRAFEQASGVELIVDDTPGMIIISSFDPVRRQITRIALENLIMDGRVQPAKIEEMVQKAQEDINKIIKKKGEEAVYETGIYNLDPRIVAILGRLYFRTSYGQNVLQHSIEMAHIAGMVAEEIGADVQIAKAGALVHDIGKALDHEVQGSHVDIGIRILEKFGADERIVLAMRSHHDEYPYETTEAYIVQIADAISGGRPGARRDTVENYIKRLQDLEATATSFEGIEKAYALSAGREIRVFVRPDEISDLEAKKLAQNIAQKIEADLKYPGEIKVIVIRENRVTEYAR